MRKLPVLIAAAISLAGLALAGPASATTSHHKPVPGPTETQTCTPLHIKSLTLVPVDKTSVQAVFTDNGGCGTAVIHTHTNLCPSAHACSNAAEWNVDFTVTHGQTVFIAINAGQPGLCTMQVDASVKPGHQLKTGIFVPVNGGCEEETVPPSSSSPAPTPTLTTSAPTSSASTPTSVHTTTAKPVVTPVSSSHRVIVPLANTVGIPPVAGPSLAFTGSNTPLDLALAALMIGSGALLTFRFRKPRGH